MNDSRAIGDKGVGLLPPAGLPPRTCNRGQPQAASRLNGSAEAHDFIVRQPEGDDTVVGERGTALSGDHPRLAEEPTHLVLDEATSALGFRIYNQ